MRIKWKCNDFQIFEKLNITQIYLKILTPLTFDRVTLTFDTVTTGSYFLTRWENFKFSFPSIPYTAIISTNLLFLHYFLKV